MDYEIEICDVCKEPRSNLHHNNTVPHKFHYLKWLYTEYRKALISDRHGVIMVATPIKINQCHYDIKGKYITKVTPEQLFLHNSIISYDCKIFNKRRDSIFLSSVELMHPSEYFSIQHTKNCFNGNTFPELTSGACYTFKVTFNQASVINYSSYKIPLLCNVQTLDEKSFTIVRTFLVIVEEISKWDKKLISPFTSKNWKEVTKIVPTSKTSKFIDEYPIDRKCLKLITYGIKRFEGMSHNDEKNLKELKELLSKFTEKNYNKFWHILLWMEERAQALMLMKYNMQGVTMQITIDDKLELEVPGLAEKRPSVIVGDYIKIRTTNDHTAYIGFVCDVKEKTIVISDIDDDGLLDYIRSDPSIPMDVSFMVGRIAFERCHRAVDRMMHSGMVTRLFPPKKLHQLDKAPKRLLDNQFFNKLICNNSEQRNAVNKILNCGHTYPYIVFGPPGTGKTVTIVEAILQIKKTTKKRILVCAPANSACDMLADRLIPFCAKEELLRIHSSTRERMTITEKLKEYSNMENDDFTQVQSSMLLSYRIIVATLTLIGRFSKDYHPDYVFIDEASQASEPETDIPISLIGIGKQVVLAGDPQQLGPMVTDRAGKFGLGISLLERLMRYDIYRLNQTKTYDSDFITMLQLNFRSHPDILLLPNDLFYHKLLKAVSSIPLNDPLARLSIYPMIESTIGKVFGGAAIEFCAISSKEKREGSSPSFFNLSEAMMVVKYVQALHKLKDCKIKPDQIGVVTPYKRQVFKIKESLKRSGFKDIEVGTTEVFQGREKRIIIISTVRAQHSLLLHDRKYRLGFVKNPQRFNVALTRAISKLIIIGCPLVLKTDDKWEKFMDLCESRKTYFGDNLEINSDTFRSTVLDKSKHFKHVDDQYNY